MAGPVAVEELAAGLVEAFVGVSAKIVALSLQEIGRQALAAVGIVKGEGGAEGRNRNAFLRRSGDYVAPGTLRGFDGLPEEGIEEQVRELRVFLEGRFDFAEE